MKLTRRQEEFVQKMIELKQEVAGPIHYSLLAERLGVSPFTAYDMLTLLEEKGYVTSVYQIPTDKCGPGRAERVFYPAETAQARQHCLVDEMGGTRLEGEALTQFVLSRLRQGNVPDPDLAEDVLERIRLNGAGEMRYCIDVMTVCALRLEKGAGWQSLIDHLPKLLPGEAGSCKANLCLLGGFILGLLAQQSVPGHEWLSILSEHVLGYVNVVMGMSSEDCQKLAALLGGVFTTPPDGGEG